MDANVNQLEGDNFTPRSFRDALGCFATGIVVVTAHPAGYKPLGLTVNSFASVSLDPPLVLWSLDRDSDTNGPFLAADHFAVNVLRSDQESLSTRFSTRGQHDLAEDEYTDWTTGAPILENTLAQFDCQIVDRIDGGDHIIMLGKVLRIASQPGDPLLYNRGQYRHLQDE